MNIEINENHFSGLIKYCNKNNIDFQKVVEDSIVQNQLRHNIDAEGNVYKSTDAQTPNKEILSNFLINVFHKDNEDIYEAMFGEIYENHNIENCKYIIAEYKNCDIVIITNDEKIIDQMKDNGEIENVKIEKRQAYSWITSYQTKAIYAKTGNSKIILINEK
jgi:hypothetical protein